jgi:hypothetical protein
MFDDWKRAWRQAVENFQRELDEGPAGMPPRVRAMERELVSAAGALAKLDDEIRLTGRSLESERQAEQVCRRRETLARAVPDPETVRVAAEFAATHAERAAVLHRKLDVLREERALLARDVDRMRQLVEKAAPAGSFGAHDAHGAHSAHGASGAPGAPGAAGPAAGHRPASTNEEDDRAFSRLEKDARERAAAERLEELKRRMGG